jgi:hypothetical protein
MDGWVWAEWAAHPSPPIQLTSTNQKRLFAKVNLSLLHFTEDIKLILTLFTVKYVKLTII